MTVDLQSMLRTICGVPEQKRDLTGPGKPSVERSRPTEGYSTPVSGPKQETQEERMSRLLRLQEESQRRAWDIARRQGITQYSECWECGNPFPVDELEVPFGGGEPTCQGCHEEAEANADEGPCY